MQRFRRRSGRENRIPNGCISAALREGFSSRHEFPQTFQDCFSALRCVDYFIHFARKDHQRNGILLPNRGQKVSDDPKSQWPFAVSQFDHASAGVQQDEDLPRVVVNRHGEDLHGLAAKFAAQVRSCEADFGSPILVLDDQWYRAVQARRVLPAKRRSMSCEQRKDKVPPYWHLHICLDTAG